MIHDELMYLVNVFLIHLVGSYAAVMSERLVHELAVRYLLVLEQVGYVRKKKFYRERLLDVSVSSHFKSLDTGLCSHHGGKKDDRNVAYVRI